MSMSSISIARIALTAAAGTLLTTAPAFAAKPAVVTVPAAVLKDSSSKLCMPRSTSRTAAKDKSLPATLCQTVEEWAAHGVTVRTK